MRNRSHRTKVEAEVKKVHASKAYMAKEKIREALQSIVEEHVASGKINTQEELEQFWSDVDLALTTLKFVPFDAWLKKAGA